MFLFCLAVDGDSYCHGGYDEGKDQNERRELVVVGVYEAVCLGGRMSEQPTLGIIPMPIPPSASGVLGVTFDGVFGTAASTPVVDAVLSLSS